MRHIILNFCLLLFFASCQKEIDLIDGSSGNTGNGGGSRNDYQPTTANSEWQMKSTTLGDYSVRSLGTDTMVNGLKYFKFNHSIGGRQYISKQGGVYKQLANMPQAGGWVSFVYLKEAAVGSAWTENIAQAEMRYSIAGTGLQKTVNGKQYSNVIHLRYEQYAMGMKTGTGDQYFAKGTGPIEAVARIDMFGVQATIDSTYLVSSIIK